MIKVNLKKIILMLVIFAIFIGTIGIKSLAAENNYTCTLTLKPDKKEIQVGESVILTMSVSNIQAGSGIAIYNGVIDVNTDIFDVQVQSDNNNVWGVTLIEDSLTITKSDYETTSEDQDIGKIILTVKEGAKLGKQTIALKSNEFSSDTESFTIGDVSTEVTIVENGGGGDQNNTNTNTGGNSSSGGNNTNIGGNNISSNSVVPTNPNSQNSGLTLPKTGLVGDFLIIGIIVGVVAGIVTYIKYKRAV